MTETLQRALVLVVTVGLASAGTAHGGTGSSAPADPKRVARLVAATAALLPRSAEVLAIVVDNLDPKRCASGQKILTKLKTELKKDKKLIDEFTKALEQANDADKSEANERIMTEHGERFQAAMGTLQQRQQDLVGFQANCPKEYKAVRTMLKTYMPKAR